MFDMIPMKTFLLFLLILVAVPSSFAQSTTVNWATTYQTMDGFGGQTWASANSISDAQADLLFSTTAGIGLSIVRTANTPDNSIPDIVTLQKAVARGAKVELGLQSPPAFMKTSNNFSGGSLLSSSYSAYATYIVNWIKTLASDGVPVSYLDIQNEPDVDGSGGSCTDAGCLGRAVWTASNFDIFVANDLGPALASAGLNNIKVMLPSLAEWFDQDLASTCLNDSNCARYVSIVSGHGYEWSGGNLATDGTGVAACCHSATPYPLALNNGKHVWLAEVNGGLSEIGSTGNSPFDPSIADAMVWSHNLHDFLTISSVSGWEYWELASWNDNNYNDGWVDHNFNPGKRYYALGNWTKFVRPGWVRIGTTTNPQSGVYVTAFKETSSGKFAIIVLNRNSGSVDLSVSLSGFPSVGSVTPIVTSASDNLAEQSVTAVSGGEFSYSLPATSVVTFIGTASASASNPPNAPTNLVVTVH